MTFHTSCRARVSHKDPAVTDSLGSLLQGQSSLPLWAFTLYLSLSVSSCKPSAHDDETIQPTIKGVAQPRSSDEVPMSGDAFVSGLSKSSKIINQFLAALGKTAFCVLVYRRILSERLSRLIFPDLVCSSCWAEEATL